MAKYSNKSFEELDITRAELKDFEEALKKEEFRNLLRDYVEEVNDPKNRELYEQELTQFENERGVDIKFVHPNPGYVIKTSVDGEQKAFINICSNDSVGKPVASHKVENGISGNDWSIPYLLTPPKVDLDKKNRRCVVYDVIFHPLTLNFAKGSIEFRNLVNDTAISGVEDSFHAKIDRNNIKFPKMEFKGPKTSSVIRKLRNSGQHNCEASSTIPNCPYPLPTENKKPNVTKPRKCNYVGSKCQAYTTPKYIIKHRKGIEYSEFLDTKDSKIHSAIPSELVVEIDLPLLGSASDAVLDVCSKTLSIVSEKPVKYKLELSLPYEVDESNGSAKFDSRTKKLFVNLPVIRKSFDLSHFSRDDSGIESDPSQNRSSSDEDVTNPVIEVLSSCDSIMESDERTNFRKSDEVFGTFLSDNIHYVFPPFSVSNNNNSISAVINVKNIDPSSVFHQYILSGSGVHLKFASLGSGHFPINYSFCLQFPSFLIDTSALKVEVWDNNLIISLDLIANDGTSVCSSYMVGPHTKSLEKRIMLLPKKHILQDYNLNKVGDAEDDKEVSSESNDKLADRITPLSDKSVELEHKVAPCPASNVERKENKENDESEDIIEDISNKVSLLRLSPLSSIDPVKPHKVRTLSESNAHPPCLAAYSRRSILKTSRSLSESNSDEYHTWSSLDSSDTTEEVQAKKTVRFSDVILKKVFRPNSSILGQKHKNEKKYRNRKKMARRRRASESEVSEASDFSDFSEMSEASEASEQSDMSSDDQSSNNPPPPPQLPGGKQHRRRGSKNSRKNAATAKQNNFILSQD